MKKALIAFLSFLCFIVQGAVLYPPSGGGGAPGNFVSAQTNLFGQTNGNVVSISLSNPATFDFGNFTTIISTNTVINLNTSTNLQVTTGMSTNGGTVNQAVGITPAGAMGWISVSILSSSNYMSGPTIFTSGLTNDQLLLYANVGYSNAVLFFQTNGHTGIYMTPSGAWVVGGGPTNDYGSNNVVIFGTDFQNAEVVSNLSTVGNLSVQTNATVPTITVTNTAFSQNSTTTNKVTAGNLSVSTNANINNLIVTNNIYGTLLASNLSTWQTANYALATNDAIVYLTGNHTATMPNPANATTVGRPITIFCSSSGTNAILPNGAETFNGKGMLAATKWTNGANGNATVLVSNGTNWWIQKTDN